MKRSYILIAIGLWVLVAAGIVGVYLYGVKNGFGKITSADKLIKEEAAVLNHIGSIVIEGSHQSVEIRKTDGDSIKVSQYSNTETGKDNLFLISKDDDRIKIYFEKTWNSVNYSFFNFNTNERLVVEIPGDFTGDLDIKTSSGSIRTEDEFTLKDTRLESSSGSIHINQKLSADNLDVKASSGGIRIGNIVIKENVTVKTSSGSIKFDGTVAANDLKATTTSGGIRAATDINVGDRIDFESSSGGIKFDGTITANDLKATTTSGGIHAAADINVGGRIELESSSGSINISGTATAEEFSAKANSGGIHLGIVNVEKYNLKSSSGSIDSEGISGGGEAKTSSGGIRLSLVNPQGNVSLVTSSGSIKITLESSLQFNLNAETSSGGIHTNFTTEKNQKGNRATAKIGDTPVVNINAQASSGGIRVEN